MVGASARQKARRAERAPQDQEHLSPQQRLSVLELSQCERRDNLMKQLEALKIQAFELHQNKKNRLLASNAAACREIVEMATNVACFSHVEVPLQLRKYLFRPSKEAVKLRAEAERLAASGSSDEASAELTARLSELDNEEVSAWQQKFLLITLSGEHSMMSQLQNWHQVAYDRLVDHASRERYAQEAQHEQQLAELETSFDAERRDVMTFATDSEAESEAGGAADERRIRPRHLCAYTNDAAGH